MTCPDKTKIWGSPISQQFLDIVLPERYTYGCKLIGLVVLAAPIGGADFFIIQRIGKLCNLQI
jgi:hypothetical protein